MLLTLSWALTSMTWAAVDIDPDFWESYEPYHQYSPETIRDLAALHEGDLLETARDIDGLELRVVGRSSPISRLISARIVIDSAARERLQVKVIPFELSPNADAEPVMRRRQVTQEQAEALTALLERQRFWDAPYSAETPEAESPECSNPGRWIVEAFRPGRYQLIARIDCGRLDPTAAEIRDFLLDLAGVLAEPGNTSER